MGDTPSSPRPFSFDLITCVHGLHYIGDKLDLIARCASWLLPNGRFAGNLDLKNVAIQEASSRILTDAFRRNDFTYDSRSKLLELHDGRAAEFPFRYLGADDQAGPNYTGQPAVTSHYRIDS